MSARFTSLLIIGLLISGLSFGQDEVDKYRRDLENANKEIKRINDLKNQKIKERKINEIDWALKNHELTQKQRIIGIHRREINRLDHKITETNEMMEALGADLTNLKTEYARLIQHAYKTRSSYDKLMFIFSAEDFNQAFRRLKYYQQYTDYRERQASLIVKTQDLLEESAVKLADTKAEKQVVIDALNGEKKSIAQEKEAKERIIRKIRENEAILKAEMRKKEKQARELNKIIDKMIADYQADEARRLAKGDFKYKKEMALLGKNFLSNKGKLPWPVVAGKTVKNFGKGQKDHTGFLMDVNGIVVATKQGSDARAIYDGTVKKVVRIPGSGKVVLVKHGDYTTVYNHLQEVYVKPGDQVKAKDKLGKILTDDNGDTIIELQVWKSTTPLNPALWLTK